MIEKIKKIDKQRALVACLLIIIGVLGRIFLREFLPNTPHWYMTINGVTQPVFMMDLFFIVAVVSFFSGILLGGYYTFMVPVGIMLITDFYYGNNYIFLFTWSGFALIGLLGYRAKKAKKGINSARIMGIGMGSVLVYDLWTNFGCWLGWYPHSIDGLIMCYTLALPFTFWHLLSTAIAIPLISIPLLHLKKNKIIESFTIRPVEKYITISASAFLIAISFITVIF